MLPQHENIISKGYSVHIKQYLKKKKKTLNPEAEHLLKYDVGFLKKKTGFHLLFCLACFHALMAPY